MCGEMNNVTVKNTLICVLLAMGACSGSMADLKGENPIDTSIEDQNQDDSETDGQENTEAAPNLPSLAEVTGVTVSGDGPFTFSVTVASQDSGCDGYADWWEVVTLDGELLYRRILGHSHVDEQPFTRSGGPVDVAASTEIVVRAHFNNGSGSIGDGSGVYGGKEFKGSIATGLSLSPEVNVFPSSVGVSPPQPSSCAF